MLPFVFPFPNFFFFFFFCGIGAWTQGLHLEPLYQLFLWRVFWDRVSRSICPGWLPASILQISASWVARIGASHWLQLPFLTFNKLHLHPCVPPWIPPYETKNLEVFWSQTEAVPSQTEPVPLTILGYGFITGGKFPLPRKHSWKHVRGRMR
jgi:hypothetical protein